MMIRSTPPASAHLAERPVPAPAPMIGLPGVDLRPQARERLRPRHADIISWSRSAIASANAGSLTSRSSSCSSTFVAEVLAQRREQRLVGGRVVERPPSVAIIETPFSGTNSAVGPVAAESFRAIRRPSSAHSSGVVRISVIVGLWT